MGSHSGSEGCAAHTSDALDTDPGGAYLPRLISRPPSLYYEIWSISAPAGLLAGRPGGRGGASSSADGASRRPAGPPAAARRPAEGRFMPSRHGTGVPPIFYFTIVEFSLSFYCSSNICLWGAVPD
ncbi:unnamed protein product [Prorocentrum cordatum]|uniref:Uncharacterized protein n=1 Tax=Prorocentrum cordatum TaxID=2364126 RepID=A0ABN9SWT7_9DINO|nr:unnamed protein product [Polarella glacialis]